MKIGEYSFGIGYPLTHEGVFLLKALTEAEQIYGPLFTH